MKKKKGSTLVLTLAIISTLLILVFTIVFQTSNAYKRTIRNEQMEKVTLMAESGIEKGIAALKDMLHSNPAILTSPTASFAPASDLTFSENNINTTVTFVENTGNDGIPASEGKYVKITSTAIHGSTNYRKSYSVYVIKSHVTNLYYNYLFDSALTTLDEITSSTSKSFYMQNGTNDMVVIGNMYLQGKTVDISPDAFDISSGEIVINSRNFQTNITNQDLIDRMRVSTATTVPSSIESTITKVSPDYLPNLTVRTITDDPIIDNDLQDFYTVLGYTNPNAEYSVKVKATSTDTLAIFKVLPIGTPTMAFNWSSFVTDVKFYIMRNMLGYPYNTKPSDNNYNYFKYVVIGYDWWGDPVYGLREQDLESDYEEMYKLYLIKGNAEIKKPTNTSDYINHIVYVQGNCNIKKADSGATSFLNSAIMAKTITIEEMGTQILTIEGPSPTGSASASGLSPFSDENRAKINEFCIKHLGGYSDALKFGIYRLDEN